MSDDSFSVDTEALRSGGAEFMQLGSQVSQLASAINRSLAAIGNCWGDDAFGVSFEQNYLPARDDLLTAVIGVAEALTSTGEQVEQWASAYEATETFAIEVGTALQGEQPST